MSDSKIIECPDCQSKVSAVVLAKREYPPTDDYDPIEVYFLECPVCHRTMVGESGLIQVGRNDWEFEQPTRSWPEPRQDLDWSIPHSVRRSIDEARLCFTAKAYSACAVMCGRALEALCKEHSVKDWQLAKGLGQLKDRGIIDGRLFEWGNALRERRNIGAHATDEEISREDASDVLDFTVAICDYVYVLAKKYDEFESRQKKRKPEKAST